MIGHEQWQVAISQLPDAESLGGRDPREVVTDTICAVTGANNRVVREAVKRADVVATYWSEADAARLAEALKAAGAACTIGVCGPPTWHVTITAVPSDAVSPTTPRGRALADIALGLKGVRGPAALSEWERVLREVALPLDFAAYHTEGEAQEAAAQLEQAGVGCDVMHRIVPGMWTVVLTYVPPEGGFLDRHLRIGPRSAFVRAISRATCLDQFEARWVLGQVTPQIPLYKTEAEALAVAEALRKAGANCEVRCLPK